MAYEFIELEQDGALAILRFNRPEQYNALNREMASELLDAVVELHNDDSVRAVMVTGKGNAFHAGGDIKWFDQNHAHLPILLERTIADLHGFISRLIRMPKPVVAAVNGSAAGAGFSLAMGCDLVVAQENAVFTVGYTKIGATPDGGSTFYLPRLIGMRRAMELVMTNRVLSAREAEQWGLVTRVFPEASFEQDARNFALEMAAGPTLALGHCKDLLYHSPNHELETQLELEARGIINSTRTKDFREGTKAFVEKRTPDFRGG